MNNHFRETDGFKADLSKASLETILQLTPVQPGDIDGMIEGLAQTRPEHKANARSVISYLTELDERKKEAWAVRAEKDAAFDRLIRAQEMAIADGHPKEQVLSLVAERLRKSWGDYFL